MAAAPSYKAVLKHYNSSSANIKWYFDQLPSLINHNYPYEVSLAYLFLRTEKAQNRALYCGVVKLHKANSQIAENAVNAQHLTRDGFLELYKNVYGQVLPDAVKSKIKIAEKIRDSVIHGKSVTDSKMREALCDVVDYAAALNKEVQSIAGFEPFGNLKGFKGAGQSLDTKTTRWLLKGMGFGIA